MKIVCTVFFFCLLVHVGQDTWTTVWMVHQQSCHNHCHYVWCKSKRHLCSCPSWMHKLNIFNSGFALICISDTEHSLTVYTLFCSHFKSTKQSLTVTFTKRFSIFIWKNPNLLKSCILVFFVKSTMLRKPFIFFNYLNWNKLSIVEQSFYKSKICMFTVWNQPKIAKNSIYSNQNTVTTAHWNVSVLFLWCLDTDLKRDRRNLCNKNMIVKGKSPVRTTGENLITGSRTPSQ